MRSNKMASEEDTAKLVEHIHKAVTENQKKEETIKEVLGSRTLNERQKLVKAYQETHKKPLKDYFTGSGKYDRLVYRLCLTWGENLVCWLREARHCGILWVHDRALVALLVTHSADDLEHLKKLYEETYTSCIRMQDEIESATWSPDFKVFLKAFGNKEEDFAHDIQETMDASSAAHVIASSTTGADGTFFGRTDEKKLCQALASGPYEYRQEIVRQAEENVRPFLKVKGEEKPIEKLIECETSGWLRKALLMNVCWLEDQRMFYVRELHHALFGGWFGVDHLSLRNYLVDINETEFLKVKEAYEHEYDMSLTDAVQKQTKGAYQELLLAIIDKELHRELVQYSDEPPKKT